MKLSQDIVFSRLLMKYPVYFSNRSTALTEFDYPVIYEEHADIGEHVVIVDAHALEKLLSRHDSAGSLYICVGGKPPKPRTDGASVIVVEKNVSLIGIANTVNEIYHEFEEWDNAMKAVLYESGSFQDLVNCCDSVIIEPIAITDKEFQVVAYSKMSDELGYNDNVDEDKRLKLDAFNTFIELVDYVRLCKRRNTFIFLSLDGNALCKNIFFSNDYVGSIGIKLGTGEEYIQVFNAAILEIFHSYAERLYAKYASFDDREFSKISLVSILQDSINKKEISEKLSEELYKENRWNKDDELQLIQFKANPRLDKALYVNYLSSKINRKWPGNICFTYMDHLLLLMNLSKSSDPEKTGFFQALSVFLRENTLIAGVSRAFKGLSCLHSAYEQTETAAFFGEKSDPAFHCYMFDNYVLDFMLQNSKGFYNKEDICSSKLTALIRHDTEKGTDYHKTLRTYFECKYNAAEAAKRLFINRSTFHYRLDRIRELSKIDFESDDELLYLAMSLKILDTK
jgi:hypothetical protein